jgi:hypothetical protein
MTIQHNELQKADVNEDGTTVLKCLFCSQARSVSVAALRDKKSYQGEMLLPEILFRQPRTEKENRKNTSLRVILPQFKTFR